MVPAWWAVLAVVSVMVMAAAVIHKLRRRSALCSAKKSDSCVRTTIVLGSGGHTTEMLRLVSALDPKKYTPKTLVVADTDQFSLDKAKAVLSDEQLKDCKVVRVPRSREVRQSS